MAIDNNEENLPISARYNAFLDGYDYSNPAWFVFAHEDFELEELLLLYEENRKIAFRKWMVLNEKACISTKQLLFLR